MAVASAIPMPPASTGVCLGTSDPARDGSTPTRSSIATRRTRPFRYGTVARNSLTGPGIVSVDASANKRFQFKESYVELRVEVFNLPNHPIWSQPGSQLRTPNFGVINSTRLDSRQIQLGLKFVF